MNQEKRVSHFFGILDLGTQTIMFGCQDAFELFMFLLYILATLDLVNFKMLNFHIYFATY